MSVSGTVSQPSDHVTPEAPEPASSPPSAAPAQNKAAPAAQTKAAPGTALSARDSAQGQGEEPTIPVFGTALEAYDGPALAEADNAGFWRNAWGGFREAGDDNAFAGMVTPKETQARMKAHTNMAHAKDGVDVHSPAYEIGATAYDLSQKGSGLLSGFLAAKVAAPLAAAVQVGTKVAPVVNFLSSPATQALSVTAMTADTVSSAQDKDARGMANGLFNLATMVNVGKVMNTVTAHPKFQALAMAARAHNDQVRFGTIIKDAPVDELAEWIGKGLGAEEALALKGTPVEGALRARLSAAIQGSGDEARAAQEALDTLDVLLGGRQLPSTAPVTGPWKSAAAAGDDVAGMANKAEEAGQVAGNATGSSPRPRQVDLAEMLAVSDDGMPGLSTDAGSGPQRLEDLPGLGAIIALTRGSQTATQGVANNNIVPTSLADSVKTEQGLRDIAANGAPRQQLYQQGPDGRRTPVESNTLLPQEIAQGLQDGRYVIGGAMDEAGELSRMPETYVAPQTPDNPHGVDWDALAVTAAQMAQSDDAQLASDPAHVVFNNMFGMFKGPGFSKDPIQFSDIQNLYTEISRRNQWAGSPILTSYDIQRYAELLPLVNDYHKHDIQLNRMAILVNLMSAYKFAIMPDTPIYRAVTNNHINRTSQYENGERLYTTQPYNSGNRIPGLTDLYTDGRNNDPNRYVVSPVGFYTTILADGGTEGADKYLTKFGNRPEGASIFQMRVFDLVAAGGRPYLSKGSKDIYWEFLMNPDGLRPYNSVSKPIFLGTLYKTIGNDQYWDNAQ
jgi:hypothetical protein